ncbi:flagellar hook-basal body complex protein [Tropicimonas sp. IMCC34043]|uniref:flagellar hook-basal body complex protein n=1 Tax=Tropicimonas sp. IMCC34043 TaxID=2248760 RepID=UPI000E27F5CD|nr:flagellar hook-basal body complex protein [Tropicimonas sp. IMCC34043]
MGTAYVTISRQSGLWGEMRTIANNISNLSTSGFRREGVVFSEFVKASPGAAGSISMASARGRHLDLSQGPLDPTGGEFDLAIEGEGFFWVDTPGGQRLTRAGSFQPNEAGDLVTPDGYPVLDDGGAPIFVPPDARDIAVASDGTLSADGQPVARIGVVRPDGSASLAHESGALFAVDGDVEPVEEAKVLQGFVEGSNVNPVLEVARMIEVQRAYELGQAFGDREGDRLSKVIETLTR